MIMHYLNYKIYIIDVCMSLIDLKVAYKKCFYVCSVMDY